MRVCVKENERERERGKYVLRKDSLKGEQNVSPKRYTRVDREWKIHKQTDGQRQTDRQIQTDKQTVGAGVVRHRRVYRHLSAHKGREYTTL